MASAVVAVAAFDVMAVHMIKHSPSMLDEAFREWRGRLSVLLAVTL